MIEIYQSLLERLKSSTSVKTDRSGKEMIEVVGVRATLQKSLGELHESSNKFFSWLNSINYDIGRHAAGEHFHHEMLADTLFHSIAKDVVYFKGTPMSSRRYYVTSDDCISFIQVLLRGDTLVLLANLRSSHYHRLLPVDLLFLGELPDRFLDAIDLTVASYNIKDEDPAWDTSSIKKVRMELSFASLHTEKHLLEGQQ